MKCSALYKKFGVTLFCIGLTAPLAMADPYERQSVTVPFGRGLNTAQANNGVNHALLPNDIKIKQGGVVQFLVDGFHQPVVFVPGIDDEDITKFINDNHIMGTFIFDPTKTPPNTFYFGINPAGGPLNTRATPVVDPVNPANTDTKSNAQNRIESVGFPATVGNGIPPSPIPEPRVSLVICNVSSISKPGCSPM